jgi:hypothetical protein
MKGDRGMAKGDRLNKVLRHVEEKVSVGSVSTREYFSEWLKNGNAKKYSSEVILSCMDKISDYAIRKKISIESLWEYQNFNAFKPIYNKFIEAKLLHVTDRNTYKVFILAGKLYLCFLKEKPWKAVITDYNDSSELGNIEATIEQLSNDVPALIHSGSADTLPLEYTYPNSGYGNKYDSLKFWLTENNTDSIKMSFSEIAELVGGIPPSAYRHRAFWSNSDSHPFAVAWMAAGYKVTECDLQSEVVRFDRGDMRNAFTHTHRTTVKAALIEFSNNYKGEIKTRREIIEELSAKYGYNEYSILPADYEIGLSNSQPKLFKRNDHGAYLCLGYDTAQTRITSKSRTQVDGYSLISDDEKSKLIGIVADKFKNGFRMSSSIDFERFKNYYIDEYGKEFQCAADRLHYVLSSEALVFDDRAYVYGDNVPDTVRMYLAQMNSPCIYIDAFFNKFSDELYALTIFSVDMLRAFIEKNYNDISVKWDYILLREGTSPSDLIEDVFSERETWSFDELQERLPCLKMDTIRQTLNGAAYFRVDKGIYTHIDNMDLPESEGAKIITFVISRLQEHDYVTANELDLSKFEYLNPHCSFASVRDAVFYKFLSNNYDKSGQVITQKGGKLRVLDIIEQYCREVDAVSFDELNTFEATFDPEGRTHSQCLIAGHNTMVRVSRDLFVSDRNVDFDVARIDEAIALYCNGNFISLQGVADFSLFPYAGYHWNLFLLESYVRRFSHVFKYDVRAVNSANIGAIVRKSYKYNDYDDILAHVLAKSSVSLSDKKAVVDYLFDNGYIGWRNLGKSEGKIIKSARELREGVKI